MNRAFLTLKVFCISSGRSPFSFWKSARLLIILFLAFRKRHNASLESFFMGHLLQLLPTERETTPEALAASALKTMLAPLGVGAAEAVSYCNDLSQRLLNDARARAYPSLQALGFWLRPGSVVTIIQDCLASPEAAVRAPRGIVFQIPPRNVTVLFGYTSALSLLGGNVTLLRLPENPSLEQELLLTLIRETLEKSPEGIRNRLLFVRYGHDDAITSALSAMCDARMVWGGDETVQHIRTIPLPPLAREISFADRFSAAALNAERYAALSSPERQQVVRAVFNDIYLFDQMACSSPRLLVWAGDQAALERSTLDFYQRLADYALETYGHPGAGENLSKLNAHYLAMHDLKLAATTTYNAALTVMSLASWEGVSSYKALNYGYGLLLATRIEKLRDLAIYAEKRDQTLSVWGFSPDEIHAFVAQCGGRGFDRVVPIGQALSFDPIWDGNNMFDILTRLVQVTV